MKRWQSIAIATALAVMAFGPLLPDPVGHAIERQWVHLGWAAAAWLMSLAGFEWLQRTRKLPTLKGLWALIVPAFVAWQVVSLREYQDLIKISQGTLPDPWWKSLVDTGFWLIAILLWVWVTYRLAPRLDTISSEVKQGWTPEHAETVEK